MNIGDKIRDLRKSRKMTQEQLAEYLLVSSQAVSKWETGTSSPDIDMLPRLAVFFGVSIDELMDFNKMKIDEEIESIVDQSIPLRSEPRKAEAFYRDALKKYPNNDVLLNCLMMVIPDDRYEEKIKIGEHLLDCTQDDEIRLDAIRLMARTYHNAGEDVMADYYLSKLPELYFLKTEIAAFIKTGPDKLSEIRKTEDVCLRILTEMLAMRINISESDKETASCKEFADRLLGLYEGFDDQAAHVARLKEMLGNGTILNF